MCVNTTNSYKYYIDTIIIVFTIIITSREQAGMHTFK
jgi:hypothetical protein